MADIRINALATTATTPASDDFLALDGTAQGTRKILATNIANNVTDVILGTSGPSVKSSLSARAPRQGLVFNGTSGATVSVPAFGTSDFSVVAVIAPNQLATSTILTGSSNAFDLGYTSAGRLDINLANVSAVLQVAGAVVAGKYQVFTYTRTGGVGTLYRNGISIASGTDNSNYSAAITSVGGSVAFSTGYVFPLIYNRALSASEVVALYEAGAPAGADYGQGTNDSGATVYSGQQMVNGDNSTFASDTGWWTKASGVSITGGKLVLSSVATGSAAILRNSVLKIGIRYRVTFTISNYSAGGVKIQFGGTSGTTRTANGTYTEEVVCGSSNTNLYPLVTVGTTTLDVDDLTVTPSGLLLAPDAAQAGGGLVWYDTSGNAANITLPASGVSWNVPTSGVLGGNWSATGTFGIGSTSSVAGFSSTEAAFIVGATRTDGSGVYPVTQTISDSRAYNSSNPPAGGGIGFGYKFNSGGSTAIGPSIQGFKENTTDGNYAGGLRFLARANGASPAEAARITSGGNFLLGTTTDSANGRVQLATHTTSAGGIGFGTDISLWRNGTESVLLGGATASLLGLAVGGSRRAYFYHNGTQASLSSETGALVLLSNATTALTLDASQNATFAGTGRFNGAAAGAVLNLKETAGVPTALNLTNRNSTQTWSVAVDGASVDDKLLAFIESGSVRWSLAATTGNATFAGAIAIGNTVNTVSPTSPNRTITMVIGGTTYYIHAKTTND